MSSSAPIVDRIRIIPRPNDFLDRNVGASGELFFSKDSNSLRVYSGKDLGGFEVARADLANISTSVFANKIAEAGGSSGSSGGTSISISDSAPNSPENGNLWLSTQSGYLYVYVDDGSSSQWIQPAIPAQPIPALATVATTGDFNDLINKPQFSDGFSGSYNDLTNKPTSFSNLVSLAFSTGATITEFSTDITLADASSSAVPTEQAVKSYVDTSISNIVIETLTGITLTGTTTLSQTTEILNTKTGATGVVVHDYSTGAIFYHSGATANFTANFTNIPTTNNRTISVALVISQGGTPYLPTAVQIDGSAQTIAWQGASAPTGNANQLDLVSFTLLRTGNTWTVLGSLTTYG